MNNKKEETTLPEDSNKAEERENAVSTQLPYERIIFQVVKKIRYQPFLFVIAIGGLIVGLAVNASGIASPDLRFLIVVIAVLAFLVILGYYILEGWKLSTRRQAPVPRESKDTPAPSILNSSRSITGKVTVEELSDDAQLSGVEGMKEEIKYSGEITGVVKAGKVTGRSRATGVSFSNNQAEKSDQ